MSLIERGHRPAFCVLFASFVLFGTSVTVIGAVLPRVLADFAWDYLAAGSVLATGSVGYFLAAYLAGRMIDRIGFRAAMVLGCVLDAAGLLAFAATASVPWNALLYGLIGVGQGFIEVAVNWSIVKMAPENSGRPMSLMHGAFSIGAVAGPVAAGGLIALAVPWAIAYRALGGLFLALLAVSLLIPVRGLQGAPGAQAHHRAELHGEPIFWLGFVVLMLYVGVETGLSNWMGEYFVSALGAPAATGAFAVSAFWMGLLAGRFGVPLLYRGSRHDRVLSLLGGILAVATFALFLAGFAHGVTIAFMASALAGFGCSCVYPVAISMVGEAFPEVQGEAMGFASAGGGLGSCVFPLGLACLARTWGIRAGFLALVPLACAVLGSGLLLSSAARRRALRRQKPDGWALLWGTGLLRIWGSAALVLLVSWGFLRAERRPLASLGLKPGRRWAVHFLAGAAGGLLLMLAAAGVIRGLDGFHWVRTAGGGWAPLGSGAGLFLAVALHEELLFRGYAFQRLVEGAGEWPALGLMSMAFLSAHWGNPGMAGAVRIWASLNIGLAGILLGLCWLKTRSLALPIGLHLGWNWAQGSLLGFGVSGHRLASLLEPVFHGRPAWLTGGSFGLEASLPCAVLCALAIAGLLAWRPGD